MKKEKDILDKIMDYATDLSISLQKEKDERWDKADSIFHLAYDLLDLLEEGDSTEEIE